MTTDSENLILNLRLIIKFFGSKHGFAISKDCNPFPTPQ
jgi:hypothetical protein